MSTKSGIRVGIHANAKNLDALIAYCRTIGVGDVCLSSASVGGAGERGYPTPGEVLAVTQRLGEGGVDVPVMNIGRPTPAALLGHPDAQSETDHLYRTLDALGIAEVSAALFYIRLPQPADKRAAADHWDRLVDYYHRLIERAERAQVRIATHAYYIPQTMLLWNVESLERLFEAEPSPYSAVTYCQKCYMTGSDVYVCAARLGPRIAFAHARDLRRDANPDYWVKYDEVFLGEGDFDWPRIIDTLRRTGYSGLICPEHLGPSPPDEDPQARAVAFLQGLLAARQAGGSP